MKLSRSHRREALRARARRAQHRAPARRRRCDPWRCAGARLPRPASRRAHRRGRRVAGLAMPWFSAGPSASSLVDDRNGRLQRLPPQAPATFARWRGRCVSQRLVASSRPDIRTRLDAHATVASRRAHALSAVATCSTSVDGDVHQARQAMRRSGHARVVGARRVGIAVSRVASPGIATLACIAVSRVAVEAPRAARDRVRPVSRSIAVARDAPPRRADVNSRTMRAIGAGARCAGADRTGLARASAAPPRASDGMLVASALDAPLAGSAATVSRSPTPARRGARAIAGAAGARPRRCDPALVDRLADDVIRRVDRRVRIERERRGL